MYYNCILYGFQEIFSCFSTEKISCFPQKTGDGIRFGKFFSYTNVRTTFPIFSAYRKSASPIYKDAIKYLLDTFYSDHLIKSESLPATSRVTLTGNDKYKLLHVKVTYPEIRGKLGVVEEHNVLPLGRTVAVKGEYSSVVRLPDKQPLDFQLKDGYTYITLPQIVGYDMFLIED